MPTTPIPIKVTILREGRNSKRTADGKWTAEKVFGVYGVLSESAVYTAVDAVTGVKVPAKFDTHPENSILICTGELDVEPTNNPMFYKVRAVYETIGTSEPTDEPPKWKWEMGNEQVPFDRDIDGNPILNSAGDPFDSDATKDKGTLILAVQVNEPFYDLIKAVNLQNAVNIDSVTLFGSYTLDPGQIKCLVMAPTAQQTSGMPYVNIEYRFRFEAGTNPFQLRLLDRGWRGWWSSAPLFQPVTAKNTFRGNFIDPAGQRPTNAPLLDGTGKPLPTALVDPSGTTVNLTYAINEQQQIAMSNPTLPAGMTVDPNSTAEAKYLIYKRYKAQEFSGLIRGIM